METIINTLYDSEGILPEVYERADGNITIKYVSRSDDFEKGVLVFLGDYSHQDAPFEKLENLIESDDWYFDVLLRDIETDKKYLVNLEGYWDYGIIIAVDDITEFISGIASCPKTINGIVGGQLENWKDIKFLEVSSLMFEDEDEESSQEDDTKYFTLSTDELDIQIEQIEIIITPF